jgi:hypothetical protein
LPAVEASGAARLTLTATDRIYHWWTRDWPRVTPVEASRCCVEQRFRGSTGAFVQIGLDWYDTATGSSNVEALVSRWARTTGDWQLVRVGR